MKEQQLLTILVYQIFPAVMWLKSIHVVRNICLAILQINNSINIDCCKALLRIKHFILKAISNISIVDAKITARKIARAIFKRDLILRGSYFCENYTYRWPYIC